MKETEANMRNLKRFLAMALTMLMLVTSLSIVTSAKFEDVTDFQNEIAVLAKLGVIKGKADGTFGFDEPVTRRQTALFFARATTGKVDDALHWQSKVNTTPFKDLDAENDYYGAISYCHNNGIVKGRSTTEFAPNDNIIFKEAITMAVRALGYKGADMDAGYPWSYYSKAVTLGLDKGIEDVDPEDVVTRGVMAKLIYNMMFATNSEGTTIAAKAFGSDVKTTVLVLVAAKGKTLVKNLDTSVESNPKLAAFVELNDDGTFNYDKVYHFDWATFAELAYGEGNEEKAVDHVGYSYTVVTLDNLKSLVTVSENPVKKLTSADYVGDGKLEGTEYELVQKWSSVFNIDATKTGKEELIQYNTAFHDGKSKLDKAAGKVYYGGYYYVVDKDNNILAEDGRVLLYYYESIDKEKIVELGSTIFPYYYNVGNLYYPAILPANTRYPGAATVEQLELPKAPITYNSNKNGTYAKNVSAYADTIVFDDNNDGVYDRAYYTYYTFGKYTTEKDGDDTYHYVTIGAYGTKFTHKNITVNDLTGELKNGAYVLWAYDAVNDSLTVKKVFGADNIKTGYVTGVDFVNKTITISNSLYNFGIKVGTTETLKYGVSNLPGATATHAGNKVAYYDADKSSSAATAESLIGVSYSLLYKSVNFIVDDEHDDKVIAVIDIKSASNPLVVTAVDTTYNVGGYVTANVIDASGAAKVITISRINGYPALNYFFIRNQVAPFDVGDLIKGAVQEDGTWIVETGEFTTDPEDDIDVTFYNGYGYADNKLFIKPDGSKLVVVVAYLDATNKVTKFEVANGIPAYGATLKIADDDRYFATTNSDGIGVGYLYIVTSATTSKFNTAWNVTDGTYTGLVTDVIYVNSVNSSSGNVYYVTYKSIINATSTTEVVYSTSEIKAGSYYKVSKSTQNGTTVTTVSGEATMTSAYLKAYSTYTYTLCDETGTVLANQPAYTNGKEVKVYDWRKAQNFDTTLDTPKTNVIYKVKFVADAAKFAGNKFVFVVEDVIDLAYTPKKVITGVTLNTLNLRAGETVAVEEIKATKDGEAVTYGIDSDEYKNATFLWYKVDIEGKVDTTTPVSTTSSYTTTKNDVGYSFKVVVLLNDHTIKENTATTNPVLLPALTGMTVVDANNNNAVPDTDIAADTVLTVLKDNITATAAIGSETINYTWTVKNGTTTTVKNEATYTVEVGDEITLTVTVDGYTGTMTWSGKAATNSN